MSEGDILPVLKRSYEPEAGVPYTDEDGNGCVIGGDRATARRLVVDAVTEGNSDMRRSDFHVRRCYLRPAVEGDWPYDEMGSGVMLCDANHPQAVKGWRVEWTG
jgi:hypothetical protein